MIQRENHDDLAAPTYGRFVERTWRLESARINGDRRAHRQLVIMAAVKFAVGLAAYLYLIRDDGPPWLTVPAALVLSSAISLWATSMLNRQAAYSRGWRQGRRAAFDALNEAERRGISVAEWRAGEFERDLRTLL